MTKEEKQQKAMYLASVKAQNELFERQFKEKARFQSLETAERLSPEKSRHIDPIKNREYNVIKEAEKIYQWLIKGLK